MSRPFLIPALLAATLALSLPTAQAAPEKGKKFGEWTINCETVGKGDKAQEICNMGQIFAAGDPPRPLLRVAVTYLPDGAQPYMIITMPLGMALPPGVQLQIDEGEKQKIPVNTCLPDGCRAGGKIADDMIAGLKAGAKLKVSFADINLKAVSIPVSLTGFTAGLAALK